MVKKEIRAIYRKKRERLTGVQRQKLDDLILIQFQKISFGELNLVHTYISSDVLKEPETENIIRFLHLNFPVIRVAAPRITNRYTFELKHFILTEDAAFSENDLGFQEPENGEEIEPQEIDLVLVPLLSFDQRGYRVGFGKGYYDRFLSHCRPDALKVGLSFFGPVESVDDVNQFDIKLDYCCTPYQLYSW